MTKDKHPFFAAKEGFCVYFPSMLFATLAVLKVWECHSDIPQFLLWSIQSCDAFRPIASENISWIRRDDYSQVGATHFVGYLPSQSYPINYFT